MVLLIAFAFVAGAGTALSPCVLPVLPAVLSAGVTGGRRRPIGVVTGLAASFTFAVVALVYVIDALGFPDDLLRNVAIAVLFAFGLTLLVPPVSSRVEAWISRIVGAPAMRRGDGFGSGFLLGGSLGFVYAPCAGPILAGVITVSAAQDFTVGRLAVALAYGIGSAAVLYLFVLGGRRIADRLSSFRGRVQVALGVVMVATAALMVADLDLKFQNAIADDLPSALVNPTGGVERSGAVAHDLAGVRGGHGAKEAGAAEIEQGLDLPVLGRAPDFTDTQQWFNTPGGEALSIDGLTNRGRVVLVDFWTYTCINCIRTLPYVKSWDEEYRDDGLTIVGVHSPEFPFEKDAGNVAGAIADNGLRYPVVQDNELGTWNAFGNQYWPAKYLIDADGNVRYVHFGEGGYETTEEAIRTLLAQAGDDELGSGAEASAERADPQLTTPETYLGAARAQGFVNGPIRPGPQDFGGGKHPASLPPDALAYRGRWEISREQATAGNGAAIDLRFGARRVFLVLGSPGEPSQMRVLLDGEPIPDEVAGADVENGVATISEQRLYRLVELPHAERHTLTLEPEPGISGYAFTFG
ncbi:MAG TPA: cytochrome c biogenesis protein DipZ [Solirubrobacterales bacterium]|nr:cytochrome c biogenesis protein DipZ [Solirubrobacterales bacterium]